jgi:hypothetical protein
VTGGGRSHGTEDAPAASEWVQTRRSDVHRFVIALVVAGVLAGCGAGGDARGPAAGAAVVEVIEDVEYYYACGNEVLELPDGRRFFPLIDQGSVDEDARLGALVPVPVDGDVVLASGTVLAVVAPGPGDDVGTLTVYDDGVAHFVSESGIEAWLDGDEREYDWVC